MLSARGPAEIGMRGRPERRARKKAERRRAALANAGRRRPRTRFHWSFIDTLLSADLFDKHFCCDLSACKGICCVEGESGAPLEEDELEKLDEVFDVVRPRLSEKALAEIERVGLYEVDGDGDYVTPIINGKECVYAVFDEQGIAKCSIEQAFLAGETTWHKPISCHLYPIRLTPLKDVLALNYHRWPICEAATLCGGKLGLSVLRFCKSALIRRFGAEWYAAAEAAEKHWLEEKSKAEKSKSK
jgi:hypothetical protein